MYSLSLSKKTWGKAAFLAAISLGITSWAHASDLGRALSFAREVMGDDITQGYEDFVDSDPDEALALLLSRDVQPNKSPNDYQLNRGVELPRQHRNRGTQIPPFRSLGGVRLDYSRLASYIDEAALQTGLPQALIDAVIRTESGYRPHAVSRTGAKGLMQLMPATARSLGVTNPLDPRQNILGGSRYLRKMYDRFGSLKLAIAAYNAGPGNVRKHKGIPPFRETRRYVKTVMSRYINSPLNQR